MVQELRSIGQHTQQCSAPQQAQPPNSPRRRIIPRPPKGSYSCNPRQCHVRSWCVHGYGRTSNVQRSMRCYGARCCLALMPARCLWQGAKRKPNTRYRYRRSVNLRSYYMPFASQHLGVKQQPLSPTTYVHRYLVPVPAYLPAYAISKAHIINCMHALHCRQHQHCHSTQRKYNA